MFPGLAAQRNRAAVPLKPAAIALLALLLAGVAFEAWRARIQPAPHSYVTAPVARGDLAVSVAATGPVSASLSAPLAFKNGGKLAQVLVRPGDKVRAGQPLARLDDADLRAAVAQAQAQLSQAQAAANGAAAKLEETSAGSLPADVAAAQAQVDAARARLDQARAVPSGPDVQAALSQLETAKIKQAQLLSGAGADDVAAAQHQLDAAGARLDALLNPTAQDLAAAQAALDAATNKLNQLVTPNPQDVKAAQAAVTSAQAKLQALSVVRVEDLAAAQAQVDQAKTKLAQLQDQPKTANPQDIANAQLAVQNAQVAYNKALADEGNIGKTGGPPSQTAADAAVQQALISLQAAQNTLAKLQQQGPTDYDVRLAQEAVNQAQANLDKLRNPSPTDLQQVQAAIDQAQAALDKLLKPSPADVQVTQDGVAAAQAALDKLRHPPDADVAAALQALAQAQSALNKALSPTDFDVLAAEQAIAQAQAGADKLLNANAFDVRAAQASLDQARAGLALKAAPPSAASIAVAQAARDQSLAQVESAQAVLLAAQANLDTATLVAPFDGTVAQVNATAGQFVAGGAAASGAATNSNTSATAFVVLTSLDSLQVVAQVNEADIGKVKPGNHVDFTVNAFPSKTFGGTVMNVQPLGTMQQNVVTYGVTCSVDSAPDLLLPGMTANVSIVSEGRKDALLVPSAAISYAQSQGQAATSGGTAATNATVLVLINGKPVPQPIQVGLSDGQHTEVLSGLLAGQLVVTG